MPSPKFSPGDRDYVHKLNQMGEAYDAAIDAAGGIVANVEAAASSATLAGQHKTAAEAAATAAGGSKTAAASSATLAGQHKDSAALSAAQASASEAITVGLASDWTNYTLPALSAQYPGLNAVDVCFYDTTKDSDGGAWTKRTDSLSYGKEARPSGRYLGQFADAASAAAEGLVNDWYYNTTDKKFYQLTDVTTPAATEIFRAGSAEFPSQVVIVAEAARVIIFDASGSELTMWMVFKGVSYDLHAPNTVTAVSMINGTLCLSSNNTAVDYFWAGLREINFLKDSCTKWLTSIYNSSSGVLETNISQRNTRSYSSSGGYGSLVNLYVKDVAMTVLPNAPIDPLTGLKVPTILVATDGGWSLITDSGVVYDGQVGTVIKSVSFGPDNEFYTVTDTGVVSVWNNVADIIADGIPADSTVSNVLGTPTVITGVA